MKQRLIVATLLLGCAGPACGQDAPVTETITIETHAATKPFPHYWEQMFGSGRAILSLRDSYRRDLRMVKKATGFEYIRFHAIFHDEVGVYDEDQSGKPVYNWSYVDQIYDGLLANGVKPFVEISFMPKKLAANPTPHAFWYKPSPAPPSDYPKWDGLISAFAKHLVERYGIEEVGQWYFEVWNEPNIDFWAGEPKQSTYFELYDHTARALKGVSPRIRVGGPSTAQAAWADQFIAHCSEKNVPVDFVSTHVYANDTAHDVFGTEEKIPRESMVCRAVKKVHDQVKASAKPGLPIIWSEYNASYMNEPDVTDSVYMAAWLPETVKQCEGLVQSLAYWDFSDVFEEQGVVKRPFYGGFGLVAVDGVPKAAFNTFALLHRLGDRRVDTGSASALVTKRRDGSTAIAVWNLVPLNATGPDKQFVLKVKDAKAASASVTHVDAHHGNVLEAYEKMGKPQYPTASQWKQLRAAGQLSAAETVKVENGEVRVTVPAQGMALIELR
jgi:xylan 1,4-beta-xylosidase